MSAAVVSRWNAGALEVRDDCDVVPATLDAVDSWLAADGRTLALDLHRQRFLDSVPDDTHTLDPEAFWNAGVAAIPSEGLWFPRFEARHSRGAPELIFRLRPAPELRRSVTLAAAATDPRTQPRVKGPDLESMLRLRTEAQDRGADEAVILTSDGEVAEGSTSCLAWWRGDTLCIPDSAIPRIDSVTLRSLLALGTALAVDIVEERATPAELDGLEVWALNALHGIRIVTGWVDGPATAEEPGRLGTWRARLDALRRPLSQSVPPAVEPT